MPLLEQYTENAYIKRTRLYFSNEDAVQGTLFDYQISLGEEISNVIGCELVNFSAAKRLTPTFRGRYVLGTPVPYADASNTRRSSPPGNTVIDMRVTDETGLIVLEFAVDLDLVVPTSGLPYTLSARFLSIAEIGSLLAEPISLALDAEGDGTLNTTNYTVNVGVDLQGRFYCYIHRVGDPTTQATVEFLFGTGPNFADSAHRVLGLPAEDTVPDPDTSGVQAEYSVDPAPVRYVDISVRELPELEPLARVFLTEADFVRPVDKPSDFRVLTQPLRVMRTLTVRLDFNDDQQYAGGAPPFHEIALEILSLEPTMVVPSWVKQRFLIE